MSMRILIICQRMVLVRLIDSPPSVEARAPIGAIDAFRAHALPGAWRVHEAAIPDVNADVRIARLQLLDPLDRLADRGLRPG